MNESKLNKPSKQSLGGQATAKKLRAEAVRRYYLSPKYCEHCGEIIPPVEGRRIYKIRQKRFCNISCSTSFNNKKHPKRVKKKKYCIKCDVEITNKGSKSKICNDCNPNFVDWSTVTLGALREGRSTNAYHGRLRSLSRSVYTNSKQPMECKVCKYDTHVDICHITPVNSFTDDALVSEVNDITNLVALCPNHHWEFDNGVIKLKGRNDNGK